MGGSKKSNVSLKKLTEMCQKITGNELLISKIKKTSIYDIPYFIADNSKVSKKYKWKPRRGMLNIVKDTYDWLHNNKRNLIKYF